MTDLPGWDSARQAEFDASPSSAAGAMPGRVVRVDLGLATIATPSTRASVPHSGELAVGDWVWTDGETWAAPMQRRTELARLSSGRTSHEQILATNIDIAFVVEPILPMVNARRIERMLTLAWASGALPMVVLTKSDLAGSELPEHVRTATGVAPGVEVLAVSAATGEGLDELRARLQSDLTFVLLGPSGAGKSTLINTLAGQNLLVTSEVRGDGRGRHTTSHRELIHIAELGSFVDTPGIRAVGMIGDDDGLNAAFPDVLFFARDCRYRDCAHGPESGCAVVAAVETGALDGGRLESFLRLGREVERQIARRTTRDRREERNDTSGRLLAKRTAMRAKGR